MTTLYHYCPVSAFVSIISTRSIWLSSLNLSNDTMEGKLISETLNRLSNREDLDCKVLRMMQATTAFYENIFHGLGFCLSEDGDLLSQWRGYADNANGFSIGFSKQYIESLLNILGELRQYTLEKVIYTPEYHEDIVTPIYKQIKEIVDNELLTDYKTQSNDYVLNPIIVQKSIFPLVYRLYTLKSAAFSEEREWRLLSHLLLTMDTTCDFRPMDNRIIPYKELSLLHQDDEPIKEVIIGPKNITPIEIVSDLLQKYNFKNVIIKRSSATYR